MDDLKRFEEISIGNDLIYVSCPFPLPLELMGASSSSIGPAVEAAALASASYSRSSDAPKIGYGTAGFRTDAELLDNAPKGNASKNG